MKGHRRSGASSRLFSSSLLLLGLIVLANSPTWAQQSAARHHFPLSTTRNVERLNFLKRDMRIGPHGQDDFTEFVDVMQKGGVKLTSPAFQSVAYGAAKTFVEATKLSGRQLSRATLLASLEQLNDFKTGVVPPLTFGPNRRIGASGCYIVGLDLSRKQYVPLGERLVPKDRK